jgi:septal ring factor EnvC (AmiA/AmiB activator)
MMARRPPLLALAGGGTEEFVRVRLLLDTTLPVIRARTAALAEEVGRIDRLQRSASAAAQALVRGRGELAERRQRFAALEAQVLAAAAQTGGAALGAGDVALASGERAERLAGEAAARRSAAGVARELAALGPAPPPPLRERAAAPPALLSYQLPANARVVDGLGEVSASGVRSRGLTLATRRGSPLAVPANGVVRFAGPFREHDGVVIIDHGGGWTSLILNVAPQVSPGAQVRSGQPLGRALGPIGVELSRRGQHWSPALIAGSSGTLSKSGKGG